MTVFVFPQSSPNRGIDAMSDHIDWYDEPKGFGRRIRDGNLTWIFQYKLDGKHRRLRLGGAELSEKQARRLAQAEKGKLATAKLGHGIDPATARDQRRAESQVGKTVAHSLGATIPKYLAARDAKLRTTTKRAIKMYLEGEDYWKPLHNMALAKIGRIDIAAQLTVMTEKNGPVPPIAPAPPSRAFLLGPLARAGARTIPLLERTSEPRMARANALYLMPRPPRFGLRSRTTISVGS